MQKPIKDVRLEVRVSNNLLWTLMKQQGIKSVAELSRLLGGGSYSHLAQLVAMKIPARKKSGEWTTLALRLAEFFRCMPEVLFSELQQYEALKNNRAEVEVSFADIHALTTRRQGEMTQDIQLLAKELHLALRQALSTLTSREQQVISLRFGLDGREHTLAEVGNILSVTRERVGQIEGRALRKLRHPIRGLKVAAGRVDHILQNSFEILCLDDDLLSAL